MVIGFVLFDPLHQPGEADQRAQNLLPPGVCWFGPANVKIFAVVTSYLVYKIILLFRRNGGLSV